MWHDERVESTDQLIVELLSRDGRMSYTDLGKATGLSTSAAQQRVRRLEQRGVITGYRAVVDPGSLGRFLQAFVSIRIVDPADDNDLPERMADLPDIVSCWSLAGRDSYLLKVAVAGPADLERLLMEIRHRASVRTETQVVLSVPYEDRLVETLTPDE